MKTLFKTLLLVVMLSPVMVSGKIDVSTHILHNDLRKKPNSQMIIGQYSGKNLFIQNPFAANGIGFCIKKLKVNGKKVSTLLGSAAFEIDLKLMGFKEGDKITVEFFYSKGCEPKILNPEVLNPAK
jgi:hypothetical protein